MIDSGLDVVGFGDLEADFLRLGAALQGKVSRDAALAGARVVRDRARKGARKRTGRLRRNIVTASLPRSQDGATAGIRVRSQGKAGSARNAFYWKFIELGTSQQVADPFIRPAFDTGIDAIEGAVRTKLAEGVDRAITGR